MEARSPLGNAPAEALTSVTSPRQPARAMGILAPKEDRGQRLVALSVERSGEGGTK